MEIKNTNWSLLSGDKNFKTFQAALDFITFELSRMMVKDGEGATKFVEIIGGINKAFRRNVHLRLAMTSLILKLRKYINQSA